MWLGRPAFPGGIIEIHWQEENKILCLINDNCFMPTPPFSILWNPVQLNFEDKKDIFSMYLNYLS